MTIDITVKIGGQAGQGIQTIGQLMALTCQKAGLYMMAINDFESRIRGGHNFFQIRISDRPVHAPNDRVNLLVGLDHPTPELHAKELVEDGLIMTDGRDSDSSDGLLAIPISELAKKAGGVITANTVAAGACLALLGAPGELFEEVVESQFTGKSPEVTEQNRRAAQLGYEAVAGVEFAYAFDWGGRKKQGMLVDGSQAIALGALAGDCRFAAFYPMSPATGAMLSLSSMSDQFPLVVEQAEDEIAAVNMVIGASFAGVRAMTATSGGGFCLMTEGLGLAAITETPVVIINAQRPGPATGLATRTGQGDLHFVIRAAQDEFPRFVFAPGSPDEAFDTVARSLHLAEKYQVPVIVLVDQYMNDSLIITDRKFDVQDRVERFVEDAQEQENADDYKRYALSPSGVSPRSLPCRGKALVVATGNEHREDGHISEAISDRNNMVEKRNAKLPNMRSEMIPPQSYYMDAKTILVGWGSTSGAIQEAVDLLRKDGFDVGRLHFVDLWPFPCEAAQTVLEKPERFITIENNSTGQLAQLIRQETGLTPAGKVLKYDGRPFYPTIICEQIKEQMR